MDEFMKKIGIIERQFKSEDSTISESMKKKLMFSYFSSILLISASTLINFLTLRRIRAGKIEAQSGMNKTTYLFLTGFGSFGLTFYFMRQAYDEIPQQRIQLRMRQIELALEQKKKEYEFQKSIKTDQVLSQIPQQQQQEEKQK